MVVHSFQIVWVSVRLDAVTGEQSSNDARARAIDRLPAPYAVALRLRDAGAADDVIAAALGLDPVSLPTLRGSGRGQAGGDRAEGPGPAGWAGVSGARQWGSVF